jgi:hypothetical protein
MRPDTQIAPHCVWRLSDTSSQYRSKHLRQQIFARHVSRNCGDLPNHLGIGPLRDWTTLESRTHVYVHRNCFWCDFCKSMLQNCWCCLVGLHSYALYVFVRELMHQGLDASWYADRSTLFLKTMGHKQTLCICMYMSINLRTSTVWFCQVIFCTYRAMFVSLPLKSKVTSQSFALRSAALVWQSTRDTYIHRKKESLKWCLLLSTCECLYACAFM